MLSTHAPVSRRGQWRSQLAVYSPNGGTDPSLCVFKFRMWPAESACGCDGDWDYGLSFGWHIQGRAILEASSDDGTGRLVPVQTDTDLILNWLFPVDAMMRLRPGSYNVSVTATLADETAEISTFSVVVS